ncbi:MAG: type II toxin-antitoxin system VapC family toxin [Kofleriaceae bacterium]
MTYLLDTDTVSFAIRGVGAVGDRLRQAEPTDIAVSVVTEAELWFGVRKLGSRKLEVAVTAFLDAIVVLDLDRSAARAYGTLRALLEDRGTPIGIADTMIAAHALSAKRVLVTSNRRHFQRVPGLKTEDWRT